MKNLDPVLQLLKMDRRLGTIVLAAIALISVAVIFATAFEKQSQNISPFIIILYLLGAVFILYMIKSIVNNGAMKTVLSWFIVIFMVVYICVIFYSVLFPNAGLPPSHCIIQFWQACENTPNPAKIVWEEIPAGFQIVTLGDKNIPIYANPDVNTKQLGSLKPNEMYPVLTDYALRRGKSGTDIWFEVINNADGETVYIPGRQVFCLDKKNIKC